MNKRSWTIRLHNDGDETGYVTLMNIVFPKYKCNIKRWLWEFKDNPFGSIQVFGDSRGKIVGHMGLTCVPIKIEECIVRGSQAVDLAVHPQFRRKGMFIEIGKKLIQEAKNEGILISYGVTKEPHGHVKHGGFYVSEIPLLVKIMNKKGLLFFILREFYWFVRRADSESISKLLVLIKNFTKFTGHCKHVLRADDFKKQVVTSFNEQIDELWEEVSKQYRLLVVRESKYLNWRYVRKPHSNYVILTLERNYRIEGYIVLSAEIHDWLGWKDGYILDLFARSKKAIRCLLQLALDYFARKNVDLVTCWMMKTQLAYNCLLERSFINDKLCSPKLIWRVNINDDKHKKLHYELGKEWFLTMGDSDLK